MRDTVGEGYVPVIVVKDCATCILALDVVPAKEADLECVHAHLCVGLNLFDLGRRFVVHRVTKSPRWWRGSKEEERLWETITRREEH